MLQHLKNLDRKKCFISRKSLRKYFNEFESDNPISRALIKLKFTSQIFKIQSAVLQLSPKDHVFLSELCQNLVLIQYLVALNIRRMWIFKPNLTGKLPRMVCY